MPEIEIDWEEVKQLRARFENARDEYRRVKELADKARKVENVARNKACELEIQLQEILVQ